VTKSRLTGAARTLGHVWDEDDEETEDPKAVHAATILP
jgi:hypothetical protein